MMSRALFPSAIGLMNILAASAWLMSSVMFMVGPEEMIQRSPSEATKSLALPFLAWARIFIHCSAFGIGVVP